MKMQIFLFLLIFNSSFGSLYTLDNGMRVVLEERHTTNFVSIQAFVRAGSIYEDEYIGSGISHFVEHMLFKGTKKRKPKEIANEIEKEGGKINAFTSFDKTVYQITIPSSSLYIAIDVLKDALFSPEFPEDELIKEKDVILKEIETRDNSPSSFLLRSLFLSAYITNPMKYPIIGYKGLFKKLEREDLINYHKKMYIPSNIVIAACGDFKENVLLNKIKRVFGNIERGREKTLAIPDEPPQVSTRKFYEERDTDLAYLNIGFHIPQINHPDIYALDLLSIILGQGRTSRLYRSLREDKGLVSSISSWITTGQFPGLFVISGEASPVNIGIVEKEILYEIERIKKDGVSKEELSNAARKIIADIYSQHETIEKRGYDLGASLLSTGNPYFSDDYIKNIKNVKPSKIMDVSKKYLNQNNMTIARLSPTTLEKKEEKIAYKERGIKKGGLPNGLTYLISPSNIKGLVSIYGLFKGGRLVEHEGCEGISNLTASLLLKDKEGLIKKIESYGGSISAYGGRNSFGISISILPEGLNDGLLILKEIVEKPGFNEEEIEKEKKRVILSIKARGDSLFLSCFDTFLKTLYKVHPYRICELGTRESIGSITKKDILSFYEDRIMPNNMVLTVFGDIDLKKTEESIKNTFKGLRQRRFYRPKPFFEPPLEENRKLVIENKKFHEAGIMMGFLGARITDSDRFPLELICSILGRQGGRLFNSLREEEGLVYYSEVFNVFGIDPGAFIMYAETSGENIERVLEKMEREITRLKDEEISIRELNAAKAYLIGEYEARYEDNSQYGFEAGLCELYGTSFEEIERYKEKINGIDGGLIKKVAEKYFNKMAIVIIHP